MRPLGIMIFITLLLCQAFAASAATPPGRITAAELRQRQEQKAAFFLVDVRPAQAFSQKSIAGAISIPAFVVHKKGLPKGATIIVYDNGIGTLEAGDAANKLAGSGYETVLVLDGGLARWEALGYPLKVPGGVSATRLVEFILARELAQAMRDGLPMKLVDLRGSDLFKAGTIPGARNVVAEKLADEAAGWPRDTLIVLFGGGDDTAVAQAELLRRAGFTMIRFLYGGYPEWKRLNAS